ncbi:MAG: hypothetical protein IKK59_01470 [Lachnospiraceae bacterium]|nr:hypothetical protein [Lachnospiraceae bacterium]
MKYLPNVWGRGAFFAYSGLEGTTTFRDSMCGQLMGEHIGMTLDATTVELYLRMYGTPWVQEITFSLVASDLIEGSFKDNAVFKFLFLDQRSIVGYTPANVAIPVFRADLAEEKLLDGGKAYKCGENWYAFTTENRKEKIYFAVARSQDCEDAVRAAREALKADMEGIAQLRRKYFDMVPELTMGSEAEKRTFAKCFSVMKSQVYTAEGVFKGRWTTPDRIPHKKWWLWDSVFHSIGNIHIEPQLAYDTLRSILDAQDPDGFIPHMCFPDGWVVPHTQPPLIAWGVYLLYEKTGRREWVEEMYSGIKSYLNWVMKNRDANSNYLYEWYVDPDAEDCRCGESGMDNTPRFDVVQLMDAIDYSCFMANEMRHMEKLARILGITEDAELYASLYTRIAEQINKELYDEEDGRYYDRELESGNFRKVSTPAGLLPLFAGVCTPERAARLAADITNPDTFNTPMPIPTVSLDDPMHCDDYWRGTVWINYNYMVEQGLREYGYVKEADHIVDATLAAIAEWYEREGVIFEVYDPHNRLCPSELGRKGPAIKPAEFFARLMMVRDFGWSSCLYVEMAMEREKRS